MANKNNENQGENFQEFYIATKSPKFKGDFVIYESQPFKLSEIELLGLIKICIIEARSKSIGKKLIAIYEDSTDYRQELTKKRLKLIGIDEDETKPTRTAKNNPRTK